jgi:hypothetical protein
MYSPGGTLIDKWRPTGDATNFTFQSMMSPLTPFKDRLTVVDGLEMSVTSMGSGHPHAKGMSGVLTGMPLAAGNFNTNGGNTGLSTGTSVDQVIAGTISAGLKFKSLEVSSGWSTGIAAGGQPHPSNQIIYSAPEKAIPPETAAVSALNRVFTGTGGMTGTPTQPTITLEKSILDSVAGQFKLLKAKCGAEDAARLEAHEAMIRQAEMGISAVTPTPSGTCATPTATNTTAIPEKGKIMTDILVAALACDLTRVGTMQWTDSEAKFPHSFLSLNGQPLVDGHHAYQHDKGFQAGALEVIYNWYASNFAYLLQKMDAVKEGNGMSLLDNSVVVWVTEIQQPESHNQTNMPFVIAGKAAGKLKSGRVLKVAKQSHNNMWVSILNLFGLPNTRFGHMNHCTGPLAGLV